MINKQIKELSVVCPVYNEGSLIQEFLSVLNNELQDLSAKYMLRYEIICIDDGSHDNSLQILKELANKNSYLRILSLSRNFGHQNAIYCGLAHSSGDAVIIMDSDFQDNPEDLHELIDNFIAGYDVVYAIRRGRKENVLMKTLYFSFYRVINKISDINLPLDAGDFSIIDRKVCNFIINSGEYHKYLRGLRAWAGYNQKGILLERKSRHSGESKYSILKLVVLALSGLCSFSSLPLRIASVLGMLMILISTIFILYTLLAKFILNSTPVGYSSTIIIIISLFGVNLLMLGIIGEYIARIYEEIKRRPSYLIKESININQNG